MIGERWGVTDDEVGRHYPCDDLVPSPVLQLWRGVTVDAPADRVWPWVRQIQIAPYSYDWIDNVGRRSPREVRLLPDPEPGQHFTTLGGLVRVGRLLTVTPGEHYTGQILTAVISYVLVPSGATTRLLMKVVTAEHHWYGGPLALGDWPMARRQLLNLKRLAEAP